MEKPEFLVHSDCFKLSFIVYPEYLFLSRTIFYVIDIDKFIFLKRAQWGRDALREVDPENLEE